MTGRDESGDQTIHGKNLPEGGVRLESEDNPDAWIEAEYRENWWKRKLLTNDTEPYEEMVEPYLLKCARCHEYDSPQLWGAGSKYCPRCEQYMEYSIPNAFELLFGDSPGEKEVAIEDV